jgi:hypothetical protein
VVAEDQLVVGLDLVTGLEVDIGDRDIWDWGAKGHNGDQTLVCKHCYEGEDLPGGPRVVALVPKGRTGGRRRKHFAHPPGMAPPRGRHHPESTWHATAKQRLRQWATAQGAQAQVEAYTGDGRRRSDVAITLPGGAQVAIEVQLGELSDTQWLARHHDYAQADITDVWLWHGATWVPRVMFARHQPGWILDLDNDQIGLLHAQPGLKDPPTGPQECRDVHWPPCPEDALNVSWMPLTSARLVPEGIQPSTRAAAELARQAAITRRPRRGSPARARRPPPADRTRQHGPSRPLLAARDTADGAPPEKGLPQAHNAFRYDAFPPWADPATWWFYCDTCGRTYTGAEIKASPITHEA